MINAVKLVRAQPLLLFSTPLRNHSIGRNATGVRFLQQAAPDENQTDNSNSMDRADPKPASKIADTMSSFGEGYATRSDEEGFGGIYGGNQCLHKESDDKTLSHTTIEHDDSQGSEVKEKEKARNQKTVA